MTVILLYLAYLGAIGFCMCTSGWLLLRASRNQVTTALMVCQILIILWCLPQLFLAFVTETEMKYVLYGISYIGISLIGSAWLTFSLSYCGKAIRPWVRVLLGGISAFDYVMFLTNGYHHLFYREFGLETVVYGPMFYVHMVFTYLCVILGLAAVLRNVKKNRASGAHVFVIVLAAAVPLFFNMLYLSGAVKAGFDLTPPVFALSSFLMLIAVFRYDFLDINVAASGHIFASISEGVIIYNRRGKITYCNPAACRMADAKTGEEYGDVLKRLCEHMPVAKTGTEKNEGQGLVLNLPGGDKVRLKQYTLQSKKGEETGGVLLLTDVGEYYELLKQSRELAVSEQRLAIEQERNRIAQEVHDTTGHTLTMIQSLIKLIRIQYQEKTEQGGEENQQLMEYLKQAQELASGGIRELRWSINHLRQGSAYELVTQGVYQLAGSVKELEVEVEIQGEDGHKYSHLSSVVYRCLREAITNCLKYAHASHMDVIVKFSESSVNVYIFDNGQGCSAVEEHHGLSGIRKRVGEAGGQVRFLSSKGEGFQIFMELPVDDDGEVGRGSEDRPGSGKQGEKKSDDPGSDCR